MRADNSHHLAAAARLRAQRTRERATAALLSMTAAGEPITFGTVAATAGVSRAWLYSTEDLRAQIASQRGQHQPRLTAPAAAATRASEVSLLKRLELAHGRIKQLTAENKDLRGQMEKVLGQARAQRQRPNGRVPSIEGN